MDLTVQSLCEMLTCDRPDIAGEVNVSTGDLITLSTVDNSPISSIVDNGTDLLDYLTSEDVRDVADCIDIVTTETDPQQTTIRVKLSIDEWSVFNISIYPSDHFFEGSKPIFTGVNVTDEHFHEQRRKVTNRVLRHNLRNDMMIISGNANLVRDQCECGVDGQIETITKTSEKLLSLSDQIRNIDKRLDESTFRFRPVAISDEVENVIAEYHDENPSVTFRSTVESCKIAGNPFISDAISELVENAIDHGGIDNDETTITISTERNPNRNEVVLRIIDNGVGIPKSESDAISESTESDLNHTSGVGLWLVKWISDTVHARFDIFQRSDGEQGTEAVLGFKHADQINNEDGSRFIGLNGKKVIRTEFPNPGGRNIGTSTR